MPFLVFRQEKLFVSAHHTGILLTDKGRSMAWPPLLHGRPELFLQGTLFGGKQDIDLTLHAESGNGQVGLDLGHARRNGPDRRLVKGRSL
jgi:hypothetical protein